MQCFINISVIIQPILASEYHIYELKSPQPLVSYSIAIDAFRVYDARASYIELGCEIKLNTVRRRMKLTPKRKHKPV